MKSKSLIIGGLAAVAAWWLFRPSQAKADPVAVTAAFAKIPAAERYKFDTSIPAPPPPLADADWYMAGSEWNIFFK